MKDRLPEIARKGVPLDEPEPQRGIREAAERNRRWDYSQEAARLYRWGDVIIDRLYPVIHTPSFQGRLPSVPMAIGNLRNKKTLAAYRIVPDDYGINFKLTFNEQHYVKDKDGQRVWRFGQWALAETLAHELGHHWQQLIGKDPFTPKSRITHNREFRVKMREIGIYCDSVGAHYQVADADSPFGILMKEWGIAPPADVPRGEPNEFDWFRWFAKEQGKERKGSSTLSKYQCPNCGLNVRIGIKDDPELMHVPCGSVLIKADKGDVYKAGGKYQSGRGS